MLSSPVENQLALVKFTIFIFPAEIFQFSFNSRCKIEHPPGHLDRVFKIPMSAKLGRLVTCNEEFQFPKSQDPFFIWSCEITWQIKPIISPLLQSLCQPNLGEWWLTLRDFNPQSRMILVTWSCKITWQTIIIISPLPQLPMAWQCGKIHWVSTTCKVAWFSNHVVFWGPVTNEIYCISTFTKPAINRHGKIVTYCEELLPIKAHNPLKHVVMWSHMKKLKNQISTLTKPRITKFVMVIRYHQGVPTYKFVWPHNHMVLLGHVTDWILHISTCGRQSSKKLDEMKTDCERLPLLKSNDYLITWQIEKVNS